MTLWIIYLTSTQPKLSKNVYVCCIIPRSLFTTIVLNGQKQCVYRSREHHFVVS